MRVGFLEIRRNGNLVPRDPSEWQSCSWKSVGTANLFLGKPSDSPEPSTSFKILLLGGFVGFVWSRFVQGKIPGPDLMSTCKVMPTWHENAFNIDIYIYIFIDIIEDTVSRKRRRRRALVTNALK